MGSQVLRTPERVLKAQRTLARPLPKVQGAAAIQGVRFENTVFKALDPLCESQGLVLERTPWFSFEDEAGPGLIAPDGLVLGPFPLVLEVKLTFTWEGVRKLQELYLPVISRALKRQVRGLLICRNLVPGAEQCQLIDGVEQAFRPCPRPQVLAWLGHGRMPW